jgi:hypothetical protein
MTFLKIFKALLAMFYLNNFPLKEREIVHNYSTKSAKDCELIIDPKDAIYLEAPDFMNRQDAFVLPPTYVPTHVPTSDISPATANCIKQNINH